MSKLPPLPPRSSSPSVTSTTTTSNASLPPLPPRRASVSYASPPVATPTTSYGGFQTPSASQTTVEPVAVLPKLPARRSVALPPSTPSLVAAQSPSPPLPPRKTPSPTPATTSQTEYGHAPGKAAATPRALPAVPKASGPPKLPVSLPQAPLSPQSAPKAQFQSPTTTTHQNQNGSLNPFSPHLAYGTAPPPPTVSSHMGFGPIPTPSAAPPLPARNSQSAISSSSYFVHPDVSHIGTSAKLSTILQNAIAKHPAPGIAIVVVKNGKIIDRGAIGVRKAGSSVPVTVNDLWHLGSCTKSFVGTLAGYMVNQGKLTWKTTIAQIFPELVGTMHPSYESVTIAQLMQHRSGIAGMDGEQLNRAWSTQGTMLEKRYEFVSWVLSTAPAATPGTTVIYSNAGTTTAAAMLERIEGKDWETMNRENLCAPLGLKSVGLGVPGDLTAASPDQPWGHKLEDGSKLVPNSGDNPPVIGPAALLHISADDFARWLIVHVEGHNGGFANYMSKENWKSLHTAPPGSNPHMYTHATGWLATESMITHDGSNTLWWCRMWACTKSKDAIVICTNLALPNKDNAESITSEVRKQLLGKNF